MLKDSLRRLADVFKSVDQKPHDSSRHRQPFVALSWRTQFVGHLASSRPLDRLAVLIRSDYYPVPLALANGVCFRVCTGRGAWNRGVNRLLPVGGDRLEPGPLRHLPFLGGASWRRAGHSTRSAAAPAPIREIREIRGRSSLHWCAGPATTRFQSSLASLKLRSSATSRPVMFK